ncbi:MAG: hypothetical protein ACD_51C00119G0002 [uncultured bacterium]|nr:MAG: hypothetical protein ACD_51C00119G0002 [uncultured bacterium]KKT01731.1 MAG: hypothetical protein UV80_C0009G0021 [Candidatus Peregrinibacteria bacterium GW2011_GWF2_43_17]KKT20646.1 MAG: hypothetical protein UW03_C0001G0016 [Candidatus Peregrinibacteria bacterium GW2011_GWA2_43_8]HAU39335.1 hypothetical protein [Candidatus Peregrinibacteria bacterium]
MISRLVKLGGSLSLVANVALASSANPTTGNIDQLATVAECNTQIPNGKTCISDVSNWIREYDGLSFITNNVPAGTGIVNHYNGGLDRVRGPEDSDSRISADEFSIPIGYVNRPWQVAICTTADLARIDASVARGEVPQSWGDEIRPPLDTLIGRQDMLIQCMQAAVQGIVIRRLTEDSFIPNDINGDGFVSAADDVNGDNMITREDAELYRNKP